MHAVFIDDGKGGAEEPVRRVGAVGDVGVQDGVERVHVAWGFGV